MIDACVGKGLRKPEFIQEEDFCTVIWRRDKVNDKVNDKVKRVQLTTNQRVVYLFVKEFDKINDKTNDKIKPTTSYIATKTHLSYPTVQRIIRFLVDNDLVHREGPNKTGYWVANI